MPNCSLRVPEASDATSTTTQSRPILYVRYHEVILAYASFRDGEYVFEASEDVCSAIDDGDLVVSFQFDEDMIPTGIILTDKPLREISEPPNR